METNYHEIIIDLINNNRPLSEDGKNLTEIYRNGTYRDLLYYKSPEYVTLCFTKRSLRSFESFFIENRYRGMQEFISEVINIYKQCRGNQELTKYITVIERNIPDISQLSSKME